MTLTLWVISTVSWDLQSWQGLGCPHGVDGPCCNHPESLLASACSLAGSLMDHGKTLSIRRSFQSGSELCLPVALTTFWALPSVAADTMG